ncbi:MAG: HD domain-containing protein [Candidatus Omnitrophica bacterium]|nr:HD domain-containing protein [Candidatus Omnitrophota bacterium]
MDQAIIKNAVKAFAKNFALLLTESSLYPPQHPNVVAQTHQTLAALEDAFKIIPDIYLDIMEGQFAHEGIPLYEIKHTVEKVVQQLEIKSIRCICFKIGLTSQHLNFFVKLLSDKIKHLNAEGLEKELGQANIITIIVEKKRKKKADDNLGLLQADKVYGSSVEANKLVYSALQAGKALPLDVVDKVAQDITRLIAQDSSSSLALASLRSYDEYTFTHSANVAILSVTLASTLIDDPLILKRLARAAILHDIGKTKIPLKILNKPDKLDPVEWQLMQQHPLFGAQILEQQAGMDELSIIIASQHHMKYDLSGYPQIQHLAPLHPLSLVVNICDIYDAISSKRPYKNSLPCDKALSIMMRLIGCDFDPAFFKIFVQMMGIYPPGTLVRLNTLELAITKRAHPSALLLPQIKIIMNASGQLLNDPLTIDLSDSEQNKTQRSIEETVDPSLFGINPLDFI